jgi:hypothetical protein
MWAKGGPGMDRLLTARAGLVETTFLDACCKINITLAYFNIIEH